MADLTVLIRLHKHELDEKRRILGEFYTAMTELERYQREFERAFEAEKQAASASGDIHFTFATYIEQVKQQRALMAARQQQLEQQITVAKESLMETFSELKKYEMTHDERVRLEAEEQLLKETKAMDDLGLEIFRRKEE